MKVDGKEILGRLASRDREPKKRYNHTLSPSVYEEFQRKCGDIPASEVLEELLKTFNSTTSEPAKKPKK